MSSTSNTWTLESALAELTRCRKTIEVVAEQRNRALEEVGKLREFVAEAEEWSRAYPEHIFTAPTPEQVDAVCNTLGFRIDRIAAMVLREFTGRWSEKARTLLASTEPKPESTMYDITFESTLILKNGHIVGYTADLTPPVHVPLPKCDHCGSIACGTDCDGSSHYTPDGK